MDPDIRLALMLSGAFLAGVLVLILGKRWITLPRLGQINYGPQRQARLNVVRLVGFAVMVYTAVVLAMTNRFAMGSFRKIAAMAGLITMATKRLDVRVTIRVRGR